MSSSSQAATRVKAVVLALAGFIVLAGCQVRPLYGSLPDEVRSIAISEPDTRLEQVVRNELIFAFGGGQGEPVNPTYRMALNVTAAQQGLLPAGPDDDFTAARTTVRGTYSISDAATGEELFSGSRSVAASLDNPGQEYGRLRGVRDAENRAGRELAAALQADIAAKLATLPR